MKFKSIVKLALAVLPFTAAFAQGGASQSQREILQKSDNAVLYQENRGQIVDTDGEVRPEVLFTSYSNGVRSYFKNTGISYVFEKYNGLSSAPSSSDLTQTNSVDVEEQMKNVTVEMHRIDLNLIGANPNARIVKEKAASNFENFYLAHVRVDHVLSYEKVTYVDIYPNIDMVLYTKDGGMKYDFVVHPGGNPAIIKLAIDGTDNFRLDSEGQLVLESHLGKITEGKPYVFQDGLEVQSNYVLKDGVLTFNIADYNKNETLIIDPTREWGTYYTANGEQPWPYNMGSAADATGAYMMFATTANAFPVSAGVFDPSYNGGYDARIVKFDLSGNLVYGTYLGGSNSEYYGEIAAGGSSKIVAAISTVSNNFPVTGGSFDPTYNGGYDWTVTQFNSTNGTLDWATYFGGPGNDMHCGVDISPSGEIAFCGATQSGGIPMIGSLDPTYAGGWESVLVKFNSAGGLVWSTYSGTGGADASGQHCVKFDNNGDIVLIGGTNSNGITTTPSVFQTSASGGTDMFLQSYRNDGSALNYGTYIGTAGNDIWDPFQPAGNICSIAVDVCSDNSVVVGMSNTGGNLSSLTTPGAYSVVSMGSWETAIVKIDNTGNRVWGTLLSSSNVDKLHDIQVDASDNVFALVGTINFPTTVDAFQTANPKPGSWTNYIAQLSSDGTTLLYGSYIGSPSWDYADVVGDLSYSNGALYVQGHTDHTSNNPAWIVSAGAYQTIPTGAGSFPYLNKFQFCTPTTLTPDLASLSDATGICSVTPAAPTATDDCGTTVNGVPDVAFPITAVGTTVVTWTYTSGAVSTTQTQNVVVSTPALQTVVPIDQEICANTSANIQINGSQVGIDYYLRDNSDNSIVDGPLAGTGGALIFNTGNLTATTNYNVLASGNVSCEIQMSPIVTVTVDATAPTAVCQDMTVSLDAVGTATIAASDIDNGSSDFCPITLTASQTVFGCADVLVSPVVVTLTVLDDNANSATCVSNITVIDDIDPTVVCQDITVQLDAAGTVTIAAGDLDNGSNDACGIASLGISQSVFDCSMIGANTVTLTVTDNNGNVATCDATVTVQDVDAPVVACQDFTVVLDAAGNGSITTVDIDNGTTDNCGFSLSLDVTDFTCANVGTNTVNLTATDASGNSASCPATVTVQDNTLPTAICQNITVQLDATGNATIVPADVDNGSNDACGIATLSLDITTFDCTNIGINTVELTVEDVNGNISTCTATVTVEDNVAPTAICQDITVQLDATGNATITTADIDNGSNDACGIASLALDITDFDCSNVGPNTVTLTVTDNNGNVSTCTSTVTVEDNVAPVALCQDITVQLDAAGMASITTGDIDNGSNDACGIASLSLDITNFDCSDVGVNLVTLTVTDNNGNVSTCTANVTVEDTQAPMVVCPSDIVLDAVLNNCGRIVTYNMVAVDNCAFTVTQTDGTGYASGDLFPVGTTPQSFEITDQFGNTTLCSFNVTIEDNQLPSITGCPADITVNTQAGVCQSTAGWIQPTASDNCPGVVFGTSHAPGSVFPLGTTTVTYTATDASGNVATCTFDVIVVDNQAPIFVDCPADITISNDPGLCEAATLLGSPTVTDNCSVASVTPSFTGPFPVGTTVVTWTAIDGSGNSSICTQNVIVIDDEAPIALCQNITVQLDATGNTSIVAGDIDNGSSDNCGIATLTASQTTFDCSNIGANTVTLTVEDIHGNTSTCTATVTVEDNVAPVALCQDIIVQLDAAGNATITGNDIDNGSSDACGIASVTVAPNSFTCGNIGANAVVLTVTDNNGNVSTCNATVTVEDNVAPTAVCQDITVQLDAAGNASIVASDIDGGSTDACGILSLSADITNFTCVDLGANTVTLTVTDLYGNSSTCTATVTVEDNVAPVAVCQDITVQLDATGNVSIAGVDVNGGSTDACGGLTYSVAPNAFTCAEVGVNTVTLTVTDGSGNSSTCTADVTVEDNIAPVVTCQDIVIDLDAAGNATITADDVVNMSPGGYIVDQTGTFAPIAGSGTPVFLSDDVTSGALPIGFNFDFFGTNYSNFYISSNGFLAFTPEPNGCCSGQNLPDPNAPNNLIAFAWEDINPATGGTIEYFTTGIAPNRQLVVNFNNVPHYFNSNPITVQTVLFESTNVIEVHTSGMPSDGGWHTQGIENIDGTIAYTTPGRNQSNWSAFNDYVAFIPVPASGAIDACGIATTTVDISSFDCTNVGPNTVTVTATDVNGNSASCTATVTVEDNVAPVAVCQDFTVQLDALGFASILASDIDAGSTDACGIASVTVAPNTFGCDDLGTNMVTLTVTDVNGNVSTCTATVTVEDVIAPTITCPGDIAVVNDPGDCGAVVTFADPTVTDNCAISPNLIINGGAETNDFTGWTITSNGGNGWIPTGAYGESHSGNSAFTGSFAWGVKQQVVDLVANGFPAAFLDGAPDILVSEWYKASACCSATDHYFFRAELLDASLAVVSTFNLGTQAIPHNSTNAWQNVAHTFTGFGAGVRYVRIIHGSKDTEFWAGHYGSLIDDTEVRVAALPLTQTAGLPSGATYPVGTTTNTYEVTDAAGNTSTCSFDVTVTDGEAPIALCNNITVQLDATGNAIITAGDIDGGSTDNCAIATTSIDVTTFDCTTIGANTVTLTVEDIYGNVSTCTSTVTVEDNIAPVALCQDITVQLDAAGVASITTGDIDNGSNDACGIASLALDVTNFDCTNVGANTVTLTVTDNNGNVSTCTSTVTVEDNIAPVAICQDITVQLDAAGVASITTGDIDNGSNDACGIASLSLDVTNFDCSDVGANTVTLTVTDNNGNVSTCTSTVTVEDNIAPVALCQDITVQLDAAGLVSITSGDIDNGSNDACGIASMTVDVTDFDCTNIGANTVTLTVTDNNGNVSTCTSTVTVEDNIPPVITCPVDITVSADPGVCDASFVAFGTATAVDNCSASVVIANDAPAVFPLGNTTVTWTATDGFGNSATCAQIVTVIDSENPVITCPADVIVSTNAGTCDATGVVLGMAVATDNCGVVTITNDAPATFPLGVTNVTWTATDNAGNDITCVQTVTVMDTEAPVVTCPADVTVDTDGGGCFATGVALGSPVATDNCTIASITNDAPLSYAIGTTVVTWTITDLAGNSSTCTQNVVVEDNEAPMIFCPANQTVSADAGTCDASTVALGTPLTFDNCTVVSVVNDAPASFPLGATTVTWTVTDAAGNSSNCTQIITVVDTEVPTIVCDGPVTISADFGSCASTAVVLNAPVANDNCGVASVTNNAPASFPLGTTNVTWTVTDNAGNTATCVQTVTVEDNEVPTITCPADVTIGTAGGACDVSFVALGSPVTNDNCSVASVTNDAPITYPLGTTVVTWTVTDAAGNSATCTQNVIVIDNEAPQINCPADILITADAGACEATGVVIGMATGSDNCTLASITNDAPVVFPLGVTTITWTATDGAGNTATCTQTVNVTDNELPTILCPADVTITADAGVCAATGVVLGSPMTADNCSVASVTNDAPATFSLGMTTVTWTVVDGSGNTATCQQLVTVTDNELPVIACSADITIGTIPGLCEGTTTLIAPVTSDNCSVASVLNDAPAFYPLGTTTVTWIVTDGSGNSATCIQLVTVEDTEAPTIFCPADITASTDPGMCEAIIALGSPIVDDNCNIASVTNDAPASFPLGTTVVTWTIVDDFGNTATCAQTITVEDSEAPMIVCPSDIVVNNVPGNCGRNVSYTVPSFMDNCNVTAMTQTDGTGLTSGSWFPIGTTLQEFTVVDEAGNTFSCSFTITVEDNEAPLITDCPSDITVYSTANTCDVLVNYGTPVISDNCSGTTYTATHFSGQMFPVGMTTVTYTAIDNSGNTASCSFNIEVIDNISPVVPVLASVQGGCEVTLDTPVATDNCSGEIMGTTTTVFPVTAIGITAVTWTFTDANGNTSSVDQYISIDGVVDATVSYANDITLISNNTTPGATYQWIDCNTGLPLAGANDISYTAPVNGTYAVEVTEPGCAPVTSICYTIDRVALADITIEDLIIYPNPSTDGIFTIKYEGTIEKVEVIDMLGRFITVPMAYDNKYVDASEMATGKYMLRIYTESSVVTKEVIIINK